MVQEKDMKEVGGVWLPAHEKHFVEWMNNPKNRVLVGGKLTYQWKKQVMAMGHCTRFRSAVDIGAHCGLWSMHLAERFDMVHAFEPVELHRACFLKNVSSLDVGSVILYPVALGEKEGTCTITTTDTSSGDSRITGEGEIPVHMLDSYALEDVDFIKVDCEGYEYQSLKGAEETLKRCRPTVCVEQKPHILARNFGIKGTPAVDYLISLGAKVVDHRSGDYVLTW